MRLEEKKYGQIYTERIFLTMDRPENVLLSTTAKQINNYGQEKGSLLGEGIQKVVMSELGCE